MIANIIDIYINDRIQYLNERFDVNLKSLQTDFIFDFENIPVNQSNNYYQISISEIAMTDGIESNILYTVSAKVEFSFFLGNKKYESYKNIINTYLYDLIRIIANQNISFTNTEFDYSSIIRDAENVRLTELNRIEKNYLRPILNIDFNLISNITKEINNTENIL